MKEKFLLRENKLFVIGIGYRPFERRARKLVLEANVILASPRLFDVFKQYDEYETVKNRIKIISNVPDTVSFIADSFSQTAIENSQASISSIVLLASGDPFFFGIGRRMVKEFGTERVEIIPDLSSVQQAFSRINEPWDDAFFISLHGGPDIAKRRALPYEVKDIPALLQRYGKLGILTDRTNNPAVIAQKLQTAICLHPALMSACANEGCKSASAGRKRQAEILMTVCEHLGYADEKIISGTVEELADKSFADPNVVILQESGVGCRESEVRFGLREDDLVHERGLITKDEVRAVTLHRLRLPENGVFWDIGAGSGSVSIEAARLCPGLRIYAVEREKNRIGDIEENKRRFLATNISLVDKAAPDALTDLPAPDRVFIGGSGGNLGDILKFVSGMMTSGIVVINAATLETLHEAIADLEIHGFSVDVSEISVSRSKMVAGKRRMNALNPVFVVKGERADQEKRDT